MTLNTSPGFTVAAWKKGNGYERINNRRKAMLDILATSYVTQTWFIVMLTVFLIVVLILRAIEKEEKLKAENSKRSDQEEALRSLKDEIRYLRQEMPKKRR